MPSFPRNCFSVDRLSTVCIYTLLYCCACLGVGLEWELTAWEWEGWECKNSFPVTFDIAVCASLAGRLPGAYSNGNISIRSARGGRDAITARRCLRRNAPPRPLPRARDT